MYKNKLINLYYYDLNYFAYIILTCLLNNSNHRLFNHIHLFLNLNNLYKVLYYFIACVEVFLLNHHNKYWSSACDFKYFVKKFDDFYSLFSKHFQHLFAQLLLVLGKVYSILLKILMHFLKVIFHENIYSFYIDILSILFILCFYKTYLMVICVINTLKYLP
jgi:hypothetical protein